MATITIRRTNEWVNRFRAIKIFIDNEHVGSVKNNETKDFDVPDGSHTVYAKVDWAKSNLVQLDLQNKASQTLELGSFAAGRPLMVLATIYYVTIGIADYIKLKVV